MVTMAQWLGIVYCSYGKDEVRSSKTIRKVLETIWNLAFFVIRETG